MGQISVAATAAAPQSDADRMAAAIAKLEAARDRLDDDIVAMIDSVRALADQLADDLDEATEDLEWHRGEVAECRQRIAELEDENDEVAVLGPEHVDDLCHVRRSVRGGRGDDAVHALDRILSGLDSAWRTRA